MNTFRIVDPALGLDESRSREIRFSFERGCYNRVPVFLLDVEHGWYIDNHDAWVAAATWSEGGRTVRTGHLAWADRRGGYVKGSRMWAVTTTEKLAVKRLAERLETQRRSDEWTAEVDRRQNAELDAIALAHLTL